MRRAGPVRAGLLYFLLVFLLGFGLGTLRVLVFTPLWGELSAVALELPLMLTAAWLICGWLIRRYAVVAAQSARLVMGATALGLLMLVELLLSLAIGNSPATHFAAYLTPAGALGLVGQLAFGIFPLLVRNHPETLIGN